MSEAFGAVSLQVILQGMENLLVPLLVDLHDLYRVLDLQHNTDKAKQLKTKLTTTSNHTSSSTFTSAVAARQRSSSR